VNVKEAAAVEVTSIVRKVNHVSTG